MQKFVYSGDTWQLSYKKQENPGIWSWTVAANSSMSRATNETRYGTGGTSNDESFLVNIDTSAFVTGLWRYFIKYTRTNDSFTQTLAQGETYIFPGKQLSEAATTPQDYRTTEEIVLEELENGLRKLSSKKVEFVQLQSIQGRSTSLYNLDQILRLRNIYVEKVNRQRIMRGIASPNNLH